ncbi:uncharacterized protein LOC144430654 isoform X3 [Styela clava]
MMEPSRGYREAMRELKNEYGKDHVISRTCLDRLKRGPKLNFDDAKGQSITHEKLETLLVEVESILNSRPITPVIMDHSADEPLTPNHLLLVVSSPNVSPGVFTKRDCYVRQRWRQVQYLADEFWRRWIKEYLPTITRRSKWTKGRDNFKVDDMVLLVDESIPRGRWTVGRVINTFPDKHGLVRSVLVRTGTNVVRRPITKLCRFLEDQK